MGGRPLAAMNLVSWPVKELPLDLLVRVLEGGAAVAAQAGTVVVGGHSIHDQEPKYGMSVSGLVDRARLVRNSTFAAGDHLFLTKPLGTGVISTAIKAGRAPGGMIRQAVGVMSTLNAAAAEAMGEVGVSGATDVTGFGLLGHLHIALRASGAAARLNAPAVPFLPGVLGLARDGVVPGGTRSNLEFLDGHVDWGSLAEPERLALADAQTSGGLLIAVPDGRAGRLESALSARGIRAAEVGVVVADGRGAISVTGRLA